jgi:hypothetical protein
MDNPLLDRGSNDEQVEEPGTQTPVESWESRRRAEFTSSVEAGGASPASPPLKSSSPGGEVGTVAATPLSME